MHILKGRFHNNKLSCVFKEKEGIHKMNYYDQFCINSIYIGVGRVKYLFKYCKFSNKYYLHENNAPKRN